MTHNQTLSPSQQRVVDGLVELLPHGSIFTLWAGSGLGKSTMLTDLHSRLGGKLLKLKTLVDNQHMNHPLSIEDGLHEILMEALTGNDVVLMDDLDDIENVVQGCEYPRRGWLDSVMKVACTYAIESGKKLIFAHTGRTPDPVNQRCYYSGIEQFTPEDYKAVCAAYFGDGTAESLDFAKIHRFAPRLNAHQLKCAAQVLGQRESVDTEAFVNYLLERGLASNVVLSDVEPVDLNDLKGVDHVLQELETHLVVPFEQDELARQLDLKPKRGVLLYGPPGTGKTTVGRALAHRLKGKFFLIDGTCINGTSGFYGRVMRIFKEAKENAPSVIFIDDSDVIWERGGGVGLYRYLLTMLDGVENESAGLVCVILTAMDIAKLPPALIRSGRIELWLEMPMPDALARRDILELRIRDLPEPLRLIDMDVLTAATEGLTGADLRRVVEDAKNLYAYDRACSGLSQPSTEYYLKAIETVKQNHKRRAEAEARAKKSQDDDSDYYDYDDDDDDGSPPT